MRVNRLAVSFFLSLHSYDINKTHSVISSGLLAEPNIRNRACAYSCSLCRSDFTGAFGFASVFDLLCCSNVGRFRIFTVGSVGPYVLSLSSSFKSIILTAPWLPPFKCGAADCKFDSRFSWFSLEVNWKSWWSTKLDSYQFSAVLLIVIALFTREWHTFWGYATYRDIIILLVDFFLHYLANAALNQ